MEDKNGKLKEYLKYYIGLNNPEFAILLNGKWGSGKTFFIKKLIREWEEDINKKDGEGITLKPIYVSLYGVVNKKEIVLKIKETLSPFLYSKTARVSKAILSGIIKTVTHVNFDVDGDGESDGKLAFNFDSLGILKSSSDKIKGKKVLIFDDLERCKIDLEELFGYINEFVEHYQCKVILIADESKILSRNTEKKSNGKEGTNSKKDELNKDYLEFKEKLIGHTFTIIPDIDNILIEFINVYGGRNKVFLKKQKAIIKDVFDASKIENLRILKQCLIDFERFTEKFSESILKHKNYKKYLKNLVAHFLLAYLECKSGNIDAFQSSINKLIKKESEEEKRIRNKYQYTMQKHNVFHNNYIIDYQEISSFIQKGYLNEENLNQVIKQSYFLKEDKEDWEKLYFWNQMDDEEFERIYPKMLNHFKNKKINNPYKLLHVITILISLQQNDIIKLEQDLDLVLTFKEQFEIILKENEGIKFEKFKDHSFSKGYLEKDCKEYKEILAYANDKVVSHNFKISNDYLKHFFENIDNSTVLNIESQLNEIVPDGRRTYGMDSILHAVDGIILAQHLVKLTNKNLDLFFAFIEKRYFHEEVYVNEELESYNSKDKKCFVDVKRHFGRELKNLQNIKQFNVRKYIDLLGKVIKKLEKLEENKTE